ncbi:MAG: PEP-CTERM sorting domain-containing protein [Massilia sp.]
MNTRLFCLRPLCALVLVLGAGAAQADIATYTSQASFLAAVADPGVDSYDDLAVREYGATLERSAGAYTYTSSTTPSSFLFGAGTDADHWLSTDKLSDAITFSNFSGGVNALGGNFFGSNAFGGFSPGATMVLTASDGSSVTYRLAGANLDSFVGFVSSAALTSVRLGNDGSTSIWVTANNLTLAAAVPEPTGWGMMLAALALLGMAARRRR